jgi:hypothetical protein
VFPHSFLPNAAFFAVGCVAAVYLLRTGMAVFGALLLAGVALCADLALVARFAFDAQGPWFGVGLWGMQGLTLLACAWLATALSRRRWSNDAKQKDELLRLAMQSYLRGEHDAARALYARVRRADPWDFSARIGLANIAWREGQPAAARRQLAIARRLDLDGKNGDLIDELLRRVGSAAKRSGGTRGERTA